MVKGRGTTELREEQLLFWPEEVTHSAKKEKQPQKLHRSSRIAETRYENLCYLVNSKFEGSSSILASLVGGTQEQIDDVLGAELKRSPISTKLARRIERSCGLTSLWLDRKHADPKVLASKIALLDVRARLALDSVLDALIEN